LEEEAVEGTATRTGGGPYAVEDEVIAPGLVLVLGPMAGPKTTLALGRAPVLELVAGYALAKPLDGALREGEP
jgi:hypothetical protein